MTRSTTNIQFLAGDRYGITFTDNDHEQHRMSIDGAFLRISLGTWGVAGVWAETSCRLYPANAIRVVNRTHGDDPEAAF